MVSRQRQFLTAAVTDLTSPTGDRFRRSRHFPATRAGNLGGLAHQAGKRHCAKCPQAAQGR